MSGRWERIDIAWSKAVVMKGDRILGGVAVRLGSEDTISDGEVGTRYTSLNQRERMRM